MRTSARDTTSVSRKHKLSFLPITKLSLALIAPFLCGCASIISDSRYPVTFITNPPGAAITVTDEDGDDLLIGTTPATLTLLAGNGFFPCEYKVKTHHPDFPERTTVLRARFDAWYLGNFVFAPIIGALIVDPLTGAMYRFDDKETIHLDPAEIERLRLEKEERRRLRKERRRAMEDF